MIWLAWRQHRKQALFTAAGLAVLAAVVVPTGLATRGAYADLGLGDCGEGTSNFQACNEAFNQFNTKYNSLLLVGILFLVLPLLVGLFWGAPLVAREVEQGTHRFAWTQGVSRKRWLLAKFGVVGAVTLVASVVYGLGVSWWLDPLTNPNSQSRFAYFFFDMQGVVPIGYTLFAVALGVFAGTVWPKMLPAMAATLAGFTVLRVGLTVLARPRYLPAREDVYPLVGGGTGPRFEANGDWVLGAGIRDASGRMVAEGAEIVCPSDFAGPDGQSCTSQFGAGAYNWRLYQPGDRFWLFQYIEAGIFVGLAAVLVLLALRRIRRIA